MVLFASCPGFSLGFGGSFSPSSFKGEKCRGAHHICHITFQIQEMQRQLPLEVLFTNTNARIVTFRLALQQWKRVGRILVMSSEHGVISVLKHSLGFDIWLPKENFNKKTEVTLHSAKKKSLEKTHAVGRSCSPWITGFIAPRPGADDIRLHQYRGPVQITN